MLSFSVLGPVEEFAEQSILFTQRPSATQVNELRAQECTPTLASATGGTHMIFGQLDANVDVVRTKNESASARQRHSEALAAQQSRAWKAQMAALATQLNVPTGSLMMGRTSEYRGRVQQRQVLEALRRHEARLRWVVVHWTSHEYQRRERQPR